MPAPASLPVLPANHTVTYSVVDELLPPVDLDVPTSCNCFVFPGNPACLVDSTTHCDEDDNVLSESDEAAEVGN